MNLNSAIFNLINGLAHKSIVLDDIMIIFSKYVPLVFMCSIALLYFIGFVKNKKNIRAIAIDTVVITIINLLISFVTGKIYYVQRPFVVSKVNLLFPHTADASFPSDHATGTMSIAAGINKYKRTYGILLIILSILVGFSRVYVGQHYPSDVIGGYLLVLATNYLYHKTIKDRVRMLYYRFEGVVFKHLPFENILHNENIGG